MGGIVLHSDETRFMVALTDHFDPLWMEVQMNSNSRATYSEVARQLRDEGWIEIGPDCHFIPTDRAWQHLDCLDNLRVDDSLDP